MKSIIKNIIAMTALFSSAFALASQEKFDLAFSPMGNGAWIEVTQGNSPVEGIKINDSTTDESGRVFIYAALPNVQNIEIAIESPQGETIVKNIYLPTSL